MVDSFGWATPQYHLMGWALSALKLSQHYKTLHLHTDKQGKEMLLDRIGLPYSNGFVDYEDLTCTPSLWAFPKLLTYAKQDRSFLHLDGYVIV